MDESRTLLTITAETDGPALISLSSWLRRDLGASQIQLTSNKSGDTMNAVETVGIVIGSATAIANVLFAYANWRSARIKAPAMQVALLSVTVSIDDPAAVEKLTAALLDGHAA